jgi:hypothetical protein
MSIVEKPAKTQTIIRLASNLVRAPNSRSRGHEFESPMQQELGVLTKSGKTLWVRSFYNIFDSSLVTNTRSPPDFDGTNGLLKRFK